MHRDEWDDEDAEPGTYTRYYLVGFFTYKVARKSLGLLEVLIKKFLRCTGKSFSEALILATTNPQYDKRLFIDLPVLTRKLQAQNMLCT